MTRELRKDEYYDFENSYGMVIRRHKFGVGDFVSDFGFSNFFGEVLRLSPRFPAVQVKWFDFTRDCVVIRMILEEDLRIANDREHNVYDDYFLAVECAKKL